MKAFVCAMEVWQVISPLAEQEDTVLFTGRGGSDERFGLRVQAPRNVFHAGQQVIVTITEDVPGA